MSQRDRRSCVAVATGEIGENVPEGGMANGGWRSTRRAWARGLVILAAVTTGACGGDNTAGTSSAGGSGAASPPAAPANSERNRCPLTAEQVTAAVGSPVKGPDSSCGFFPADDTKITPHALFVLQVPFACNGTMPAEIGYKEQVEGLGVPAYVADMADGSHVLVCRVNSPFEISVDLADASKARVAATMLARQVLAGP